VILAVRGTGFKSPILGLRALVRRSDLPGGRDGRDFLADEKFPSASNDKVIDSGWLPCTRPAGYKNLRTPATTLFVKQGFTQGDTYQGGSGLTSCSGAAHEFDPACGTSYINYEFPRLSLPGFPVSVIGSATSTGVGGGGVTRTVLSVPALPSGLSVRIRDEIGYVDRNVPCSKEAKAKWKLVSVQGMYLWLAYLDDRLPEVERDSYVRGKTATPASPKCAQ
jgi:hypothetical protein